MDGGGLGGGDRRVHYFAPDTLEWEGLARGYSDFVRFLCDGDLAHFYEGLRWEGWEAEVAGLTGDEGVALDPPLFSREGKDPARSSRRVVPVRELWATALEFRGRLGGSR